MFECECVCLRGGGSVLLGQPLHAQGAFRAAGAIVVLPGGRTSLCVPRCTRSCPLRAPRHNYDDVLAGMFLGVSITVVAIHYYRLEFQRGPVFTWFVGEKATSTTDYQEFA